ncbi:mucoidy inhibitor MuiA family protein [Belliella sp. R4-6]|uniref:Mucoidy inhibitor MuiA family protein n=1 Tax=Belliella alkalica TaxID=1730871 RepID=A0ABS9VGF6_9BACT|nr:mucoidy inhibitor MuiA family protein [Belliella alkalica]MCH7415522.1 mucoidy inhibitor MuiA family protein [Belliella alkalica]
MLNYILLSFALVTNLFANPIEKSIKSEIKEVTVFQNGAQINERSSISLGAGETILTIKGKSPYIDSKSIQVKGFGDFTILSVNVQSNYLEEKISNSLDSLQSILDDEKITLQKLDAQAEVLREKMAVLNTNKNLGGQNNGLSMVQLKQALDFFEKEIASIKNDEIVNRQKSNQTKEKIQRLEMQLNESSNKPIVPVNDIIIKVSADRQVSGELTISYLVNNAGWFPKYDVRAKDISKPLDLRYKAEVWQNTGNDWNNVKLKFSNATPQKSGVIPDLKKWDLTYARLTVFDQNNYRNIGSVNGIITDSNGQAIPGANITVKGSSIGTTSDLNGRYSLTLPSSAQRLIYSFIGYRSKELTISGDLMNVILEEDMQSLNEVVITGYGGLEARAPGLRVRSSNASKSDLVESFDLETTTIENQTTVEIAVDKPYTITSNGDKLLVDLKKYEVNAVYEYFAIPKKEKDAFLVAKLVDWEKYNLLQGEANLYFEDTYIGRTILEAESLNDTLSISLGRDRSIVIEREKIDQSSTKRLIGSNYTETRAYKITVKNNKSSKINLKILDQYPISIVNDISVNLLKSSNGNIDKETGIIDWELILNAGEQKVLELEYEVKYPRREKVILDR